MTIGTVTKWYDPSYGVTYEGATQEGRLLAFDDNAISGYGVLRIVSVKEDKIDADLNGNGHKTDTLDTLVLLLRKNDIGGPPQVLATIDTY